MTTEGEASYWVVAAAPIADLPTVASPDDVPPGVARVVLVYSAEVRDQIARVRARAPGADIVVVVPEDALSHVGDALALGVDEVICGVEQLRRRHRSWEGERTLLTAFGAELDAYEGMVFLIHEMAAHPDLQEVLRIAIIRMAKLFAVEQVSVVLFKPGDEFGFVVAERDRQLDNIVIRLNDYPELQEIIRTHEPLVISDVLGDALLAGVQQKLEEAGVRHLSSVLFPLIRKRDVVGALFLRSHTRVARVDERVLSMGRIIASVTSIAIGNALEQDKLLSDQRALMRDKEFADRALADLQHFVDFFDQARDGIVVTDPFGLIRYANASASEILRQEKDALREQDFVSLLSAQYHRLARRAIRGEAVEGESGYVDLLVAGDPGDEIVISAAVRVLRSQGGVLITFRDVTELREIESELRQTKEFLENLIQSSVDAIVAADIEGVIILFNRAAEHLLGYSARDAVGKLTLDDLFAEGEAADVMRRLRSDAYGGRGRLELIRRDLVDRGRALVPVNLTASVIFEDDEEIASVMILTDLRERMRIEEKLSQVERQLQVSERQAVAMELAGVAAHELNQPLTSILGYAELLKRRLGEDTPHRKPIDVICRETERMALIVKRIGQITQYKSKPYVGESTILDLDPPNPDGESSDGGEKPGDG